MKANLPVFVRQNMDGLLRKRMNKEDSLSTFACAQDMYDFQTVTLLPPTELPTAESDQDSDEEDPDHISLRHLPKGLETESVEMPELAEEDHVIRTEAAHSSKKRKVERGKPRKAERMMESAEVEATVGLEEVRSTCKSPYDYVKLFINDDFIAMIETESKRYAAQRGFSQISVSSVGKDSLYCFIGVLLVSGYVVLPNRKLYWSMEPDVHNELISKAMRRDKFDQIMKCLHFRDNLTMGVPCADKMYKVRPLFDHLNSMSQTYFPVPANVSVKETVVPYFSPQEGKQFSQEKPTRFGFKLWNTASADGVLLWSEPYSGSSAGLNPTPCGPDSSYVQFERAEIPEGSDMEDNTFGSLPLLVELTERGKTQQDDQVRNEEREARTMSTVKNVLAAPEVDRESIVKPRTLSGVDLFDATIAKYRISIRSRKWYWCLFSWVLSALAVNAWKLYGRATGESQAFLPFLRQACQQMLSVHGLGKKIPGRHGFSLEVRGAAKDSVRCDGLNHWPQHVGDSNPRCRECKGRSKFMCDKCQVPLHPQCFRPYHTK